MFRTQAKRAVLPLRSGISQCVTKDHSPSTLGDTRTFQAPPPSWKPPVLKLAPPGPVTVAENATLNGLTGMAALVKAKSCGCHRGTSSARATAAATIGSNGNRKLATSDTLGLINCSLQPQIGSSTVRFTAESPVANAQQEREADSGSPLPGAEFSAYLDTITASMKWITPLEVLM